MGRLIREHSCVATAGMSDPGLVRTNNEDRLFVVDHQEPNAFGADSYGIYLIADGMGGHQAGEVAGETAMRTVSTMLLAGLKAPLAAGSPTQLLKRAIEQAHQDILDLAAAQPALRAMGTTVTVGLRLDRDLYLGHVGDSRAYLVRDGGISQLTEDHSVVAQLLKQGALTPQQANRHPDKGKILRCLGVTRHTAVDTALRGGEGDKLTLRRGDTLVFCSDGLNGYVANADILRCVAGGDGPGKTCRRLIDLANGGGGGDNTSVIVVRVS
jgi:serine/threonine protein phosphatase PrpC